MLQKLQAIRRFESARTGSAERFANVFDARTCRLCLRVVLEKIPDLPDAGVVRLRFLDMKLNSGESSYAFCYRYIPLVVRCVI